METDTPTSDTPWSSEEDVLQVGLAGGSAAAAINLDGAGPADAPEESVLPVSFDAKRVKNSTSKVWNNFEELFITRNGKKVKMLEERRRWLTSDMVEVLSCLKDWELVDAQLQHNIEKETKDLDLAFENMFLDDDDADS
nr:uncharacterized protein LOC117836437 [Setaria viridis]